MRTGTMVCLAGLVLGSTAPARAVPATPEEAQRLTTLFGRFVGKSATSPSGAVTVMPAGEDYRVVLDVARLLAPLAPLGVSVAKTGDFVAMLTPQPDGTWRVTNNGLPSIAVTLRDQTTTVAYDAYAFDGIFDPKISMFRSSTVSSSGITAGSVAPNVSSDTRYTGSNRQTVRGEDAGDGTDNITSQQTIDKFDYRVAVHTTPSEPDSAPSSFTAEAKADAANANLHLTNEPIGKLLDLWAFLVAHPSKPELAASQADLKTLLLAVLAANPKGSVDVGAQHLAVDSPMGRFGLGSFAQSLALAGDKASDSVTFRLKLADLALPAGLAPAWTASLVPTTLDTGADVGPFHLNQALLKAVASFDLNVDPPISDQQGKAVAETLAVPQDVLLTLAPTTITTALMTLKLEGQVRYADPMPFGSATVRVTGLDQTINAVQAAAADDPNAAQAVAFLSGMRLLAQTEPDGSYSWHIEAKPGMPATLNGKPLTPTPPATTPPTARKKLKPKP